MNKIKIAITGGPSGGKTTLIETLQKNLGGVCSIVPEAASILYKGGFPRYDEVFCQKSTQIAIYYTQLELENIIAHISKAKILICDRGSLDGIAYWPDNKSANFFKMVNSNEKKELSRYDWVIHLDTADKDFYETTNPIRTESYEQAKKINSMVRNAWKNHSRRIIINHNRDFISKMQISFEVINKILSKKTYEEIIKTI